MTAALKQKPISKIKLEVVKGPHAGQVFSFDKESITIGRGPENDVVLINDPLVSRVHAQVQVINKEVEVVNLSQKNSIFIGGESVAKWKLVNQSSFSVGDSEFKIEYDLGLPVVSVKNVISPEKPQPKAAAAKPILKALPPVQSKPTANNSALAVNKNAHLAVKQNPLPSLNVVKPTKPNPANMYRTVQGNTSNVPETSDSGKKNIYIFVAIALVAAAFFYFKDDKKEQINKKIVSTLKYEDEVNIKLNSKAERELMEIREKTQEIRRNSPQYLRVEENFVKGMRDYENGQYLRAQESFQLVLNLDPDHVLAKRHLQLSKARFDELVQQKLMLGDSNFKKHNFKMCQSYYTQVVNMLAAKPSDEKYQIASQKARECELASEGIR